MLSVHSAASRAYSKISGNISRRASDRPARPFGEGILEETTTEVEAPRFDPLPDSKLTDKECRRIVSAYWTGYNDFEVRHPGIEDHYCVSHGEAAAAKMRLRITMERFEAANKAKPSKVEPKPRNSKPYTSEDLAWWAANSPTRNVGYEVVGRPGRWDRLAAERDAESRHELGLAS